MLFYLTSLLTIVQLFDLDLEPDPSLEHGTVMHRQDLLLLLLVLMHHDRHIAASMTVRVFVSVTVTSSSEATSETSSETSAEPSESSDLSGRVRPARIRVGTTTVVRVTAAPIVQAGVEVVKVTTSNVKAVVGGGGCRLVMVAASTNTTTDQGHDV